MRGHENSLVHERKKDKRRVRGKLKTKPQHVHARKCRPSPRFSTFRAATDIYPHIALPTRRPEQRSTGPACVATFFVPLMSLFRWRVSPSATPRLHIEGVLQSRTHIPQRMSMDDEILITNHCISLCSQHTLVSPVSSCPTASASASHFSSSVSY